MKKNTKNPIFFLVISLILSVFLMCLYLLKTSYAPQHQAAVKRSLPTVVIDAGHGGEDGGAIGKNGIPEKELNLKIALKIGKALEENGINVIYTRTEDVLLYDKTVDFRNKKKALDLAARVKIAEELHDCVFVSIHMNSFSEEKYNGLQVYYSKNHKDSYVLASAIQNEIKSKLQPQNTRKATIATSRIFVLDRITKPAVLIECGFLSNTEECRLLCTDLYQNELTKIISEEIKKYVEKISKLY